MVVSAIIVLITSVLLFQQSKFNSSTLLRSLTYSVALSIRSAQIFGTSVREFTPGSGTFAQSYGVYFLSGDTAHYYLFSDNNNDGQRASDGSEDAQVFSVGSGYAISKFCGKLVSTSVNHCSTDASSPLTNITILFKRPNPDALFSSSASGETYGSAYVQVRSTNASTRGITVSSTGQIIVGNLGS